MSKTFRSAGKKSKIFFEHRSNGVFNKPYRVKKLLNRVEPEVGKSFTKDEVQNFTFDPLTEVEIT